MTTRELKQIYEQQTLIYTQAKQEFDSLTKTIQRSVGLNDIPYLDSVRKVICDFGNATKQYTDVVLKMIVPSIEQFRDVFEKISYQQKVADQLNKIGSFGWTALPNTDFDLYLRVSTDKESIDNFFLNILSEKAVESLFDNILELTESSLDIKEAIRDYKNGCFKSCSLLLFSLIDRILISNQKQRIQEYDDKPSKNRRYGKHAAENIYKFMMDNLPANFHYYHIRGINSCLMAVFDNANDFKKEEVIINRQFIVHGMTQRIVERKDCLQLFLLYRNMLSFIRDYNTKFC